MGFPLAWSKTEGGHSIRWIGAHFECQRHAAVISIPQDRCRDILNVIDEVQASRYVSLKKLRAFAGKVSSCTQVVTNMKPFIDQLWAAISVADAGHTSCRPDTVFINIKDISRALLWLRAFFSFKHCVKCRIVSFVPPANSGKEVWTDASPWGIGGVLTQFGVPIGYFGDKIQTMDLRKFGAARGDSKFNTLWEALAVLVALKIWHKVLDESTAFKFKTDNVGVMFAHSSKRSRDPKINVILREIALIETAVPGLVISAVHSFGVANTWPDALSRLEAPSPCIVPAELALVKRFTPVQRDSQFWMPDSFFG